MQRWSSHTEALRSTIELRTQGPTAAEASNHARLVFLDTIGCALAGRAAPEVAALERNLAALEPGSFQFPRAPGLGLRAATQILATATTWHEACEGHAYAHGRPGIPVIAALLPLALHRDATLGEFIDALVVGYEVGARAGGWLRVATGLHVDGNWPALGVAAGVARLLGLSADASMTALQIVACQLPASLYLPIRTGRNVRNVYLAHSATLGLDSALAAQAGIQAPADALAYVAEHLSRAATELPPPPERALILDAYLKPFAAVRHVHYGALAARRIRGRMDRESANIRRIVLTVYEEASVYCGNPQPATPLAAQFSLTFGVAAMLRFGELDASVYEPPRFQDAELRRLESLVEVRIDPELGAKAQRAATVQVTTAGGTQHEERVGPQPEIDLLLDTRGAIAKFAASAAPLVSREASESFCSALLDGSSASRLRDLWPRLGATPPAAAHSRGA